MKSPQGAARWRRPLAPTSRRANEGEGGFTVLELILVMVVIGALLSIAVPSFLTARSNTQSRAAQADLRHALEAANTAFVDLPDYSQFTAAMLTAVETSLRFSDVPVSTPGSVAVVAADDGCPNSGGCISMAEHANNGTCWFVVQSNDGAPLYGKGNPNGGSCDAAAPQNLGADFPA